MALMTTLFYFVLAICILIVVHEWGHFLVARWFDVKVLRFSVGFGRPLFSYQGKKGTEYTLCAIPLGGYIKMLDEEEDTVADKDKPYAFNQKPAWQRILIAIAGPLFNFLFAIVALWLMYLIGIKTFAPIVSTVTPQSPAFQAGLKPWDEFTQVGREHVSSWRDVQLGIISHVGQQAPLSVNVKNIKSEARRELQLPMQSWQLSSERPNVLKSIGVMPFIPTVKPVVGEVLADGAAERAGIKSGDVIKTINKLPVDRWIQVVTAVQQHPNKALTVVVERKDHLQTISLTPKSKTVSGQSIGYIGLAPQKPDWPKAWFRLERYGVADALTQSLGQTWYLSALSFKMLAKLINGEMSVRSIGGPIGIAEGASQSARGGLSYYLSFLALISISLGILNLLPVPMLDGGHVLFYVIEIIKGRPLSEKARGAMMAMGLTALVLLTMLAFFNDVVRLVH